MHSSGSIFSLRLSKDEARIAGKFGEQLTALEYQPWSSSLFYSFRALCFYSKGSDGLGVSRLHAPFEVKGSTFWILPGVWVVTAHCNACSLEHYMFDMHPKPSSTAKHFMAPLALIPGPLSLATTRRVSDLQSISPPRRPPAEICKATHFRISLTASQEHNCGV